MIIGKSNNIIKNTYRVSDNIAEQNIVQSDLAGGGVKFQGDVKVQLSNVAEQKKARALSVLRKMSWNLNPGFNPPGF